MGILAQYNILRFYALKSGRQWDNTQNREKSIVSLETNNLPAIQLIVRSSAGATIQLFDVCDNAYNDPISMTVTDKNTYFRLIYLGEILTGGSEVDDGYYYLKIVNGAETYYSDVFAFINDTSKLLKIEASSANFMMDQDNKYIFDMAGFTYLCYLNAPDYKAPETDIDEDANTDNGITTPYYTSSSTAFTWIIFGNKYILLFLQRLRILDQNGDVKITYRNEEHDADDILVEVDTDHGGGDLISIKLSIEPTNECMMVINESIEDTYLAPVVVTTDAIDINDTIATVGGNVTSNGGTQVTTRGICWSTSGIPTTDNNIITSGSGTGTYLIQMTGLTQGTVYYVRAYATNSVGTSYGDIVSFTTLALPTLSTTSITGNEDGEATSGGNILSDGGSLITARGICWNTTGSPTISDSKTSDGTGTGSFVSLMTGLTQGTVYYVRAYATNSTGTGYGNVILFAAARDIVFTLSTNSTKSNWQLPHITNTGATLHWEVTGVVNYTANTNDPIFDFSTAGTKNIEVSCSDGGTGITLLNFYNLGLTALNINECTALQYLYVHSNSLTSLDLSLNTALIYLTCSTNYGLTSLDISTNILLQHVDAGSCGLTTFDVSTNSLLVYLWLYGNSLTKIAVDDILTDLVAFALAGESFNAQSQSPAITPDPTLVSQLDALWDVVDV